MTESIVFFPKVLYSVEEKVSKLEIPVYRTGDLSDELMVICYTAGGNISYFTIHTVIQLFNIASEKGDCLVAENCKKTEQFYVRINRICNAYFF